MENVVRQRRRFILRVAQLLHAYGTPSHRFERLMDRVAACIDEPISCLYTPTGTMLSFTAGGVPETHVLRIESADVDLGKLIEFDEALERLEDGKSTLEEAAASLERIAESKPRFGKIWTTLSCGVACGGATALFGGGLIEIGVASTLGLCVALLGIALSWIPSSQNLLEPLAGFMAALSAILFSHYVTPIDDRLATLGSLVILLPGLPFTVAMTELATKHLSSGTARLAGTAATFLTLVVGVILAWRLGSDMIHIPRPAPEPLPGYAAWVVFVTMPIAFSILLQARVSEWPVIFFVSICGVFFAKVGGNYLAAEFAPFLGALAVGVGANWYARYLDRPAMVPLVPGILLLVPGTIGYRSLTAFVDKDALTGMDLAFNMTIVATCLVGGLLAANMVLPPRRSL